MLPNESVPGFKQGIRFHAGLLEELAEKLGRPVRVIAAAAKIETGAKALAVIDVLHALGAEVAGLAVIACNPLGGEERIFAAGVPNIIAAVRYKPGTPGAELEADRSAPTLKTGPSGGGHELELTKDTGEGQPATAIAIRSVEAPRKPVFRGLTLQS